MNPRFFADLRRHEVKTAAELMAAAQRARVTLRDRIKAAGKNAINAKFRDAFFGRVVNIYRLLSGELDAILKSATGKTANMSRKAFFEARALDGSTKSLRAKVIQFSPERLERYWGMIHPDNAPTLAATSKMATEEVQGLSNAVVQVFRQGDLEAWTANQRAKKLQEAWDAVAGDANPRRFVDGAGREWSNARYLQMLVRTTQARVSREALIDTTVENGDDLMRVVTAGDNCPICQTWGGLIVSVTGTNEKFPSYEQALKAGWAHVNCDCSLERVDETIDEADAQAQGDAKTPPDLDDLEAMRAYREAAGLDVPDAPGEEPGTFARETAAAYRGEVED